MTDFILGFSALVLSIFVGCIGALISTSYVEDEANKMSYSMGVFAFVTVFSALVFFFFAAIINCM